MPKIPALQYVRNGLTEGWSANEAYRNYQQAARDTTELTGERWTASNRSTFLQQYSALRSARDQIVDALNAPKDLPFGGLTPVPREATRPGAYLYSTVSLTRLPGTLDVERGVHMFRSVDELSPQEVEDRTIQQVNDSSQEAHGTFAGMIIEAVSFTGVQQLIPEGSG